MHVNNLVWLRDDLRLEDNPALYYAALQGEIRVVMTASPKQWQEHNESPAKTALRIALFNRIAEQLAQKGIRAEVIEAPTYEDIADKLADYCQTHRVQAVWFNEELPVNEQRRDEAVIAKLQWLNIDCHKQACDLIVPREVLNQQGLPFKVFTPFFKRWLSMLVEQNPIPFSPPTEQSETIPHQAYHPNWLASYREDLWPADQQSISQRLWQFCHLKEEHYSAHRDIPNEPGTSLLSPYLALGALGPRECLFALQYVSEQQGRDWRESVWLKELAWRDFYRQLMKHFPRLSKGKAFKTNTEGLIWQSEESLLLAWQQGRTGFPIVDAAMRQLNQTGWMHNRLRMICASFFCKLMFADWRKGEAYFMQTLIDGEFAANNGGWQWSASTGCDAAPYFRVFNPTRQSQTYDKSGDFIRRFVPELAGLDNKAIHEPSSAQRQACAYPDPIIDYKSARQYAIDAFANL